MKTNTQKLAGAQSTPSLDDNAPPDEQRSQLLAFLGLSPDANDDDIRALVDSILAASSGEAPADPDAAGDANAPSQVATTYRIVDASTKSVFTVRLDRRELGVCAANQIPPNQYAKAKLHMHRDNPRRGERGIRLLQGEGGR